LHGSAPTSASVSGAHAASSPTLTPRCRAWRNTCAPANLFLAPHPAIFTGFSLANKTGSSDAYGPDGGEWYKSQKAGPFREPALYIVLTSGALSSGNAPACTDHPPARRGTRPASSRAWSA
jgi:hypothetical protein